MKAVLIFSLLIALITGTRASSAEFDEDVRSRQAGEFFREVIRREPNPVELTQTLGYLRAIGGTPDRDPKERLGQIKSYFNQVLGRDPSIGETKETVRFLKKQEFLSDTKKTIDEAVKKSIETATKAGQILPPASPNKNGTDGTSNAKAFDPLRNGIVMKPSEIGGAISGTAGNTAPNNFDPEHVPGAPTGNRPTDFAGNRFNPNPPSTLVLPPSIPDAGMGANNRQLAQQELQEQVKSGTLSQSDADEILRRIDPVLDRVEEMGDDFAKMKDIFRDVPANPEERKDAAKNAEIKIDVAKGNDPLTTLQAIEINPKLPAAADAGAAGSPSPALDTKIQRLDVALLDAARAAGPFGPSQALPPSKSDLGDVRTVDGGFTDVAVSSAPYASSVGSFDSGSSAGAEASGAEIALQTDASGKARLRGFLDRVVALFRSNRDENTGAPNALRFPVAARETAGASALKTPRLAPEIAASLGAFAPSRSPEGESASSPGSWLGYGFGTLIAALGARGAILWRRRRSR